MDREDRTYLLAIWLVLALVLALELGAEQQTCTTDTECAEIDDHPAAGAPEPR